MIRNEPERGAVRRLLLQSDLPTDDLDSLDLRHFFACGEPEDPGGVVGLEMYESVALLRSLVVQPTQRGSGCGRALVEAAERHARELGIRAIFLLTETAETFFEGCGYTACEREVAPPDIRATSQFSDLCPASAAFMTKDLGA